MNPSGATLSGGLPWLSGLTLLAFAEPASAPDCAPLHVDHGWSMVVESPGEYCVAGDRLQKGPSFFELPHQAGLTGPILTIHSRNVDVDLKNHKLITERSAANGLLVNGEGKFLIQFVRVRYGTIKSGDRAAAFMV